jgi:hypothetical protein
MKRIFSIVLLIMSAQICAAQDLELALNQESPGAIEVTFGAPIQIPLRVQNMNQTAVSITPSIKRVLIKNVTAVEKVTVHALGDGAYLCDSPRASIGRVGILPNESASVGILQSDWWFDFEAANPDAIFESRRYSFTCDVFIEESGEVVPRSWAIELHPAQPRYEFVLSLQFVESKEGVPPVSTELEVPVVVMPAP